MRSMLAAALVALLLPSAALAQSSGGEFIQYRPSLSVIQTLTVLGGTVTCGTTTASCVITAPLSATGGADLGFSMQVTGDIGSGDTVARFGDGGSPTLWTLSGTGVMTLAGQFTGASNIVAGASSVIAFNARTRWGSAGDGSVAESNNAESAQTRYVHGTSKTLTDNSATTFARVAIAADTAATVCVFYSVDAENATDQQVIGGYACVPIINDAGAETCGTIVEAAEANTTSTGTITATITCTGAGTSTIDLAMTSDSSLNVTPLLKWSADLGSSAGVTITPQ